MPGVATGNVLEHSITENKCLAFEEPQRRVPSTAQQTVATGALLAANGESTNDALETSVTNIAKAVPGASQADIASGDFNNCLDFAVETVRRLGVARYLSDADVQNFVNFQTANGAAVKAATNAATQQHCRRAGANSTACTLVSLYLTY